MLLKVVQDLLALRAVTEGHGNRSNLQDDAGYCQVVDGVLGHMLSDLTEYLTEFHYCSPFFSYVQKFLPVRL